MRRLASIAVFVMLALSATCQQEFRGKWWLVVVEDLGLPLNLTFADRDGEVTPLLYSPSQSAEAIVPSSWSYANDTLRFQAKSLGLKLTLRYTAADETFRGTMRQGLARFDLNMERSEGLFQMRRPQEESSIKVEGYSEREVKVEYKTRKGEKVILSGTLTVPDGGGKYPAAVLVSGSGQQNRDEEIFGHKPFKVLADYLARHGIATLRYDDRGVGGSEGEVKNATTIDFAEDAAQMVKYLRRQQGIDGARVGIIGHSEGGTIGPIVASKDRKVAFVVMLAGPGCSGGEVILQQNRAALAAGGVEQRLLDVRVRCMEKFFEYLKNGKESDYEKVLDSIVKAETSGLNKEERRAVGLSGIEVMQMAQQMAMPWMRAFVELDSKAYLCKLKCPVLSLFGGKDVQVVARENEAGVRQSVPEQLLSVRVFDDMNHLFQRCSSGRVGEYMTIEETIAPEVMEAVGDWIVSTMSKNGQK